MYFIFGRWQCATFDVCVKLSALKNIFKVNNQVTISETAVLFVKVTLLNSCLNNFVIEHRKDA